MSSTAVVGLAVVGQSIVGSTSTSGGTGPGVLYAPPMYRQVQVMQGALRYQVNISTTVYRLGGTWFNVLAPGMSNPDPALCDIESGTLLYFNTPTVVSTDLATELATVEQGQPHWLPAAFTPL